MSALARDVESAQLAHDERVARRGYERALSDMKLLRDRVIAGENSDAKRHAKAIPGLKMACGWLERRLKETAT